MFAIGIIGVIFTIYNSYAKPQNDLELKNVATNKDLDNKATLLLAKEAEGKALLLAQQVALQKEIYDKKFTEFGSRLDDIDKKIAIISDASTTWHLEISKLIVELSTRLDERLPSKRDKE